MMEIIKEKEDLYNYNNSIFEKIYFTNGDMALRFQTKKDKELFDELIDKSLKGLNKI